MKNSRIWFCFVLSVLLALIYSTTTIADSSYKFLKTPVAETGAPADVLCADDDIRATVIVALNFSLIQQQNASEGTIDIPSTYIGYFEETIFVVTSLSDTQRAIFEIDTKYQTCKYCIEDNTDKSQNETICKDLCHGNYWPANQKAIEGVLYRLMN